MNSDRLPPQNLEAELSVMGSCLIDCEMMDDVINVLPSPSPFYRDAHQTAWKHFLKLRGTGSGKIDAVLLAESLRLSGEFETIGGYEFISSMVAAVPTSTNAIYYANIVKEKALSRKLLEIATEMTRDIYSNEFTGQELLESTERKVFDMSEKEVATSVLMAPELVAKTMEVILARRAGGSQMLGIASQIREMDECTCGFQPGQVTLLAARPGQGKSAFAINIGDYIANRGEGVLFFSLEMGWNEVMNRILAARASISGEKFQNPSWMNAVDFRNLHNASGDFEKCPFMVDDNPTRSLHQIAASARRIKRKHGLGLLMIDYLGLIHEPKEKNDSENNRVSRISGGVRRIARELEIPILALHQLNRNIENRDDGTPKMSDLRDSGHLEQDAHVILFLNRPKTDEGEIAKDTSTLFIGKNRNGPTTKFDLLFERQYTRFASLSNRQDEPPPRPETPY